MSKRNRALTAYTEDLVKIIFIWSHGNAAFVNEIAKSGLVSALSGALNPMITERFMWEEIHPSLKNSVFAILNISYNSSNHPAIWAGEAGNQLLSYIRASDFTLASTSKFALSNLHETLDWQQLLLLELKKKEADHCITILKTAASSGDFIAKDFTARGILQILSNFTHPSYCTIPKDKLDLKSKKGKPKKASYFNIMAIKVADMVSKNCSLLNQYYVVQLLENVIINQTKFQDLACRVLWNILHHDEIVHEVETNHPNIYSKIYAIRDSCSSANRQIVDCCLYLLKKDMTKDLPKLMNYAEGCYKFECYFEAAAKCTEIIDSCGEDGKIQCQAKLLKGKALYYSYQREILRWMDKRCFKSKEEESNLIDECFEYIKEAIYLLGGALDECYTDEEGSRLLDWAMTDCIRANKLNLCKRCFLCRQRDQKLRRSHIYPESQLTKIKAFKGIEKSEKIFISGKDKHHFKSAGECWIWLCCETCEAIMNQGGENEFSRKFPGEYSSWLYNYCCTLLFRELATIKLSRFSNIDEVYNALLFCRKHLLSLPVKVKATKNTKQNEAAVYQDGLLAQASIKEIEPYLFVIPDESDTSWGHHEFKFGASELAFSRLVDGFNDRKGECHFFASINYGFIVLISFLPSSHCPLPRDCHIKLQGGRYSVLEAEEAIKTLPKGLLKLLNDCSKFVQCENFSAIVQHISQHAADKLVSKSASKDFKGQPKCTDIYETTDVPVSKTSPPSPLMSSKAIYAQDNTKSEVKIPKSLHKPQVIMVPPGYIVQRWPQKTIQLPKNNYIMLHHAEDVDLCWRITVFVSMGNDKKPYIIYFVESSKKTYLDGAYISETDGGFKIREFLLDNSLCTRERLSMDNIHYNVNGFLSKLLFKHQICTLVMLVQHFLMSVKIAKENKSTSIGMKCSFEGCWYCGDLSDCCMQPAILLPPKDSRSSPYKFCSQECIKRFCIDPPQMPQSVFAFDHRAEVLGGKFEGPTVLEIMNIYREEKERFNTIENISVCLGDGSNECSHGEVYILWQICKINSRLFMNFTINEEFVLSKILWCRHQKIKDIVNLPDSTLKSYILKRQPKLLQLIKTSMKLIDCKDLITYLDYFRN